MSAGRMKGSPFPEVVGDRAAAPGDDDRALVHGLGVLTSCVEGGC
jgi:hypothetical protein